ncbi:MAG: hypothetical protein Q4D02_08640, partial [Clostridia bacterium]|nr:hypothetical protein [Clostridia bacterium]
MNFGVGIELKQDIAEVSGLRGIEYPEGSVNLDLDLSYYYRDLSVSNSEWVLVDENDEKGEGIANGIELVGYDVIYNNNDHYWPTSNIKPYGFPTVKRAKSWDSGTITDSGVMISNFNGNTITINFDDYKIDGYFQSHDGGKTISHAFFVAGQLEIFAPNYDNESEKNYNYQVVINLNNADISTRYKGTVNIENAGGIVQDVNTLNNRLIWTHSKSIAGMSIGSLVTTSQPYQKNGNYSATIGSNYKVWGGVTLSKNVLYGGCKRIFTWRSDVLKLKDYSVSSRSLNGFPIPSLDNIMVKYGVYKEDNGNGIENDELVEKLNFDDFEWYNTLAEAESNGIVSALDFDDPDHIGYDIQRGVTLFFEVSSDEKYLNDNYPVREKIVGYYDKNRTNSIKSAYSPQYRKTEYDNNGELLNAASNNSLGVDILVIPYQTSVITSVDDLTTSNKPQTTYDVQEREINFNITPKLSANTTESSNDVYVDKVQVVDYLPKGLTYV